MRRGFVRRRGGHDRRRRYKITVSCKQRISSARLMTAWVAVGSGVSCVLRKRRSRRLQQRAGRAEPSRANEFLHDNSSDKRSSDSCIYIVCVAFSVGNCTNFLAHFHGSVADRSISPRSLKILTRVFMAAFVVFVILTRSLRVVYYITVEDRQERGSSGTRGNSAIHL